MAANAYGDVLKGMNFLGVWYTAIQDQDYDSKRTTLMKMVYYAEYFSRDSNSPPYSVLVSGDCEAKGDSTAGLQ